MRFFSKNNKIDVSPEKVKALLTRGVEDVIVREHLESQLRSGKKLRIKFGIDPTSPNIHLGHSIAMRKLREFQKLGHQIVFIIGDFTATIGDPSGKSKTRPPLSPSEIKKNLKRYVDQASKVVDIKNAEVHYNSKWLKPLDGFALFALLGEISTNQILEREDFSNRLKEHKSIRMHELLYPVMQAYDSVMIKADVELGGTDQLFNILMGRDLMQRRGMEPQDVLTVPILEGLDGKEKMSKSLGNYIALDDLPGNMFGKIMSVPDDLIAKYFLLCTDVPESFIEEMKQKIAAGANPKDFKMNLAKEIVTIYHGKPAGEKAEQEFTNTFSKGGIPNDIKTVKVSAGSFLVDILLSEGLVESKTDFRRLEKDGAIVFADTGEKISGPEAKAEKSSILKIGKRRFIKIEI